MNQTLETSRRRLRLLPPILAGLACLASLIACRGPELRVTSKADLGTPISLQIRLPEGPERASRETALRDNLTSTLQTGHSFVTAENRKDLDAVLQIEVKELSRSEAFRKTVSESVSHSAGAGTVGGVATGVEVASNVSPTVDAKQDAKDGFVFIAATTLAGAAIGTAAGTVGGVSEGVARGTYQDIRLGYRPKHLICRISYAANGSQPLRELGNTDAWAVLKEMRPMSSKDAHDVQKLHQEEARALARVIERLLLKVENR